MSREADAGGSDLLPHGCLYTDLRRAPFAASGVFDPVNIRPHGDFGVSLHSSSRSRERCANRTVSTKLCVSISVHQA
jgi:hypothetical protein